MTDSDKLSELARALNESIATTPAATRMQELVTEAKDLLPRAARFAETFNETELELGRSGRPRRRNRDPHGDHPQPGGSRPWRRTTTRSCG